MPTGGVRWSQAGVLGGGLPGFCLPPTLCMMLTLVVFTGTIGRSRPEEKEMDIAEIEFINWQYVGLKLCHPSSGVTDWPGCREQSLLSSSSASFPILPWTPISAAGQGQGKLQSVMFHL